MKKILMLGLIVCLCGLVGCEKRAGIVRMERGPSHYCLDIVDKGDFLRLKLVSGETREIPKNQVRMIDVMSRKEIEERDLERQFAELELEKKRILKWANEKPSTP
jgi:hypothetical protein